MNPNRKCGMCKTVGNTHNLSVPEMVAMLPNPKQFEKKYPKDQFGFESIDWPGLLEAVKNKIPALRNTVNN